VISGVEVNKKPVPPLRNRPKKPSLAQDKTEAARKGAWGQGIQMWGCELTGHLRGGAMVCRLT